MEEPRKPEVPAQSAGGPPPLPRAAKWTGFRMSRRAKIGLAVGASFLTLVGGVFGVKQFARPGAAPKQEVAQNPASQGQGWEGSESAEPAKRVEAPGRLTLDSFDTPPNNSPGTTQYAIPNAPIGVGPPVLTPAPQPMGGGAGFVIPTIDVPPAVRQVGHEQGHKDITPPALDPLPQTEIKVPSPDPMKTGDKADLVMPTLDPVKGPTAEPKEDPFKKAALNPMQRPRASDPVVIDIPPLTPNNDKPGPKDELPPPLDIPGIDTPPSNIRTVENRQEPKRLTIVMPKKDAALKKDEAEKKDDALPKIDIPLDPVPRDPMPMPMPREVPPAQENSKRDPVTVPIQIDTPVIKPLEQPMTTPDPVIKPLDVPKDVPPAVRPDSGNANPAVKPLPPAAVGRDGGYDEDLHPVSANERLDYRSISKRYYEDEAYAAALEQYNRDTPGNGRYVRIPPIEVLMKRYPTATPRATARPASTGAPPASLNLQTEATPPAAARDNVYVVAEGGETLREVALKTLGNGDQWQTIHVLNSALNAAEKVPTGTKLRLPPQARVPQ